MPLGMRKPQLKEAGCIPTSRSRGRNLKGTSRTARHEPSRETPRAYKQSPQERKAFKPLPKSQKKTQPPSESALYPHLFSRQSPKGQTGNKQRGIERERRSRRRGPLPTWKTSRVKPVRSWGGARECFMLVKFRGFMYILQTGYSHC